MKAMEQDMEAMTEDMEAKAGERMDALQAELARALDERDAWLAELREGRDAQQKQKREAEAQRKAHDADTRELAALKRECEQLRTQMASLVGHQNHKQKIHYTMKLKEDNSALKQQQQAMGDELAKTRKLVERLRAELDRQQRRAALAQGAISDAASDSGSVRDGKPTSRKPPPLPFDFDEEQRLAAALEAERAERDTEQQQFKAFVAEVGEAAGLAAADAASSPQRVLLQLRTRTSELDALAESQRFEIELAKKEKSVLESRAMLGRRHRAGGSSGVPSGVGSGQENARIAPVAGKAPPAAAAKQLQPRVKGSAAGTPVVA